MASTMFNKKLNYDKICRVCMDNTNLQPIFEFNDKFDNETIDLSHKLKFCCNIEIDIKDRMPNYICETCSDALIVAYDLIMLCKYTDDLLRKNIGVEDVRLSEFDSVKIKTEEPFDEVKVEYKSESNRTRNSNKNQKYKEYFSDPDDTCTNSPMLCDNEDDKDILPVNKDDDSIVKKDPEKKSRKSGSGICEECGRFCKNHTDFLRHRRTHEPKIWKQCTKCPYRTTDRHSFKVHTKFKHEGHSPIQCDMCTFQTTRKDYLKIHYMRHTGEKPYSCKLCDYKAINHSNLKKHMVTHTNARDYKCNICGTDYKSNQRLKHHMLRVHEHVKMFYCTKCPCRRKFVGEEPYKRHMLKEHPTDGEKSNVI